ncbi:MAG: alpha/beta hydrolase, partial [Sulfitobacter sp.]
MTSPRFHFIPVMGHEIHVTEWGDPKNPALMMLHGLARTGRDFDEVAATLSQNFHVLCPDMIGRGRSSWGASPEAEYS